MNNLTLVNNIKKLCKDNNVSISTLEQDLNLSPGLISRWVKSTPAFDKILEIANYFHVSLDDLVGNTNSEKDTDDVSMTRLLLTLHNKSIEADIEWHVYNPAKTEDIVSTKISSIINAKTDDCFYCNVNGGSFILKIRHNNKENELSLYVLPDQFSFPELKCSDNENLYNLYNYLLKRLSKRLNTIKTNNFINKFINETANLSTNNITIMPNAVNR